MSGDNQPILYLEGHLRILMSEWVPVGSHFVEGLQRRFGYHAVWNPQEPGEAATQPDGPSFTGLSYYYRQALLKRGLSEPLEAPFFITSTVDPQPHGSLVILPPDGENKVRVEGYRPLRYIRFECKIESLETHGDQQEELIGVDISHEGHICYGIQIDSTQDGMERASLGVMANIIADLNYDTSQLMNSLFNGYQRRLLDVVHHNDSSQRTKRIIVAADRIVTEGGRPVSLEEIEENSSYAFEIRQVLGRFSPDSATAMPDGAYVLYGDNGAICVNPDPCACHKGLLAYNLMSSMTEFLDNVFGRVAYGWDKLKAAHDRADTQDPQEMSELQTELSALGENHAILASVPRHMRRDAVHIRRLIDLAQLSRHAEDFNIQPFRYTLAAFLSIEERLADLDALLDSLEHSIDNTRTHISALNDRATLGINRAMNLLTIVSVIMLPLTLIAGIYGMNFQAYAPSGETRSSPLNMPELYWPYGYPSVLGVMILIAAVSLLFFYSRGLIGSKRHRKGK